MYTFGFSSDEILIQTGKTYFHSGFRKLSSVKRRCCETRGSLYALGLMSALLNFDHFGLIKTPTRLAKDTRSKTNNKEEQGGHEYRETDLILFFFQSIWLSNEHCQRRGLRRHNPCPEQRLIWSFDHLIEHLIDQDDNGQGMPKTMAKKNKERFCTEQKLICDGSEPLHFFVTVLTKSSKYLLESWKKILNANNKFKYKIQNANTKYKIQNANTKCKYKMHIQNANTKCKYKYKTQIHLPSSLPDLHNFAKVELFKEEKLVLWLLWEFLSYWANAAAVCHFFSYELLQQD